MASPDKESRDKNMVRDQSFRTLTVQRETEEASQDDPEDASSRQDRPDPEESDERPTPDNLFRPLVERFELSEVGIQ